MVYGTLLYCIVSFAYRIHYNFKYIHFEYVHFDNVYNNISIYTWLLVIFIAIHYTILPCECQRSLYVNDSIIRLVIGQLEVSYTLQV